MKKLEKIVLFLTGKMILTKCWTTFNNSKENLQKSKIKFLIINYTYLLIKEVVSINMLF